MCLVFHATMSLLRLCVHRLQSSPKEPLEEHFIDVAWLKEPRPPRLLCTLLSSRRIIVADTIQD